MVKTCEKLDRKCESVNYLQGCMTKNGYPHTKSEPNVTFIASVTPFLRSKSMP